MNRIQQILILLFSSVLITCACGKDVAKIEKEEKMDYKQLGYTSAKVLFDKMAEEPCNYLLKTTEGELLEAIDLPYEFKVEGELVWLQFARQRRMSICANSQPVLITSIAKRN